MSAPAPVIRSVRDLDTYTLLFELQQRVYALSKRWPKEESYALTDQIRRSSRSIGANVSEAWAKRRYPAHFLSKLTDADGELQETRHWLSTAKACGYLDRDAVAALEADYGKAADKLGSMIAKYESFCRP